MVKKNYHSQNAKIISSNRDKMSRYGADRDKHSMRNQYRREFDEMSSWNGPAYAEQTMSPAYYGDRYKVRSGQQLAEVDKKFNQKQQQKRKEQNRQRSRQEDQKQQQNEQKRKRENYQRGLDEQSKAMDRAHHKYIDKVRTKSGKWRYIYDTTTKSIKSKVNDAEIKAIKTKKNVVKAANNLKDRIHSTGVRWVAKMKR